MGEDGGIVDAVTDHQDFSALFLQVFHIGELVFGRGFGAVGVQTECLRNLCDGICTVAAEQVRADALLFEDVEHGDGAVFDLVFEQEDCLETALVAEEYHAACVFDVGGFVRQHAGYSGDEIGAA